MTLRLTAVLFLALLLGPVQGQTTSTTRPATSPTPLPPPEGEVVGEPLTFAEQLFAPLIRELRINRMRITSVMQQQAPRQPQFAPVAALAPQEKPAGPLPGLAPGASATLVRAAPPTPPALPPLMVKTGPSVCPATLCVKKWMWGRVMIDDCGRRWSLFYGAPECSGACQYAGWILQSECGDTLFYGHGGRLFRLMPPL